jgi:hypothetical protein
MGCKTLHFFSPVQTGLPRELAKSLACDTQPGLVSLGGREQTQRRGTVTIRRASHQSPGKVFAILSLLLSPAYPYGDAESVRRPRPPAVEKYDS